MLPTWLLLLTGIVLVACGSEEQETPCADISVTWDALVSDNSSCTTDTDCVVVVTREDGECTCSRYLGDPSGAVIHRAALNEAVHLRDRFFSPACTGDTATSVCDGGALTVPRCDQGTCVADGRSCMADVKGP